LDKKTRILLLHLPKRIGKYLSSGNIKKIIRQWRNTLLGPHLNIWIA